MDPFDNEEAAAWLKAGSLSRQIDAARFFRHEEKKRSAEIGGLVGRSGATIRHLQRLDDALHPEVRELLERPACSLTLGHLKAVARLPKEHQPDFARRLMAGRVSVRTAERHARRGGIFGSDDRERFYTRLSERISEVTGHPTDVLPDRSADRAGRVVIRYLTLDDFEGLMQRLGVSLEDE